MNFEERVLKFLRGLIEIIIENMWGFIFLVWVATSIFSLDDLLYVKKEQPAPSVVEKKESSDGPKPSF